ncbi:MAG: sulfatase-like hydrolase/transferase, partial [bacterium]|nr:sulfatase-like hydrolase/transferase [bacterium]
LPTSEVTIAEILSEAGYATSHVGKWHQGDVEVSYPHNQGFDFGAHVQDSLPLGRIGDTSALPFFTTHNFYSQIHKSCACRCQDSRLRLR